VLVVLAVVTIPVQAVLTPYFLLLPQLAAAVAVARALLTEEPAVLVVAVRLAVQEPPVHRDKEIQEAVLQHPYLILRGEVGVLAPLEWLGLLLLVGMAALGCVQPLQAQEFFMLAVAVVLLKEPLLLG
jgi:hypothetical protein